MENLNSTHIFNNIKDKETLTYVNIFIDNFYILNS